jgi:hypothetical protein
MLYISKKAQSASKYTKRAQKCLEVYISSPNKNPKKCPNKNPKKPNKHPKNKINPIHPINKPHTQQPNTPNEL